MTINGGSGIGPNAPTFKRHCHWFPRREFRLSNETSVNVSFTNRHRCKLRRSLGLKYCLEERCGTRRGDVFKGCLVHRRTFRRRSSPSGEPRVTIRGYSSANVVRVSGHRSPHSCSIEQHPGSSLHGRSRTSPLSHFTARSFSQKIEQQGSA